MDSKELSDRIYTGGDNIIGFIKISDITQFDKDNDITRVSTYGYPENYIVRGSSSLSFFTTHKPDIDIMTYCTKQMNDIDFGYDIGTIKRALSVFKSLSIDQVNVMFSFPDKKAPLLLTASFNPSVSVGLEWGILIVSCDMVKGVKS
jgi:hypothetical protein